MIDRVALVLVLAGFLFVRALAIRRLRVLLFPSCLFFGSWSRLDTTGPVEADVVINSGAILDHGPISIGIVDN